MNKIVILNDSVQLYEHYISDDKWEKVLSFPRGGLTYLVSNGTIKFYAFEDYLYRNTLMSMPLPVHVTDDYAGIDGEISDMDELTEALDRIFPTNDVDAELDEYLKKDEAERLQKLAHPLIHYFVYCASIDIRYYRFFFTGTFLNNMLRVLAMHAPELSLSFMEAMEE